MPPSTVHCELRHTITAMDSLCPPYPIQSPPYRPTPNLPPCAVVYPPAVVKERKKPPVAHLYYWSDLRPGPAQKICFVHPRKREYRTHDSKESKGLFHGTLWYPGGGGVETIP